MSAFPTRSFAYCLPQHSSDDTIELTVSDKFAPINRPPIPAPPSGPLDAKGLQERVSYGCSIGCNRNISHRFKAFVQNWKDKCEALVNEQIRSKRGKNFIISDIMREDGKLRSRYDEVHGLNGLCAKIQLSAATMLEIRLYSQYGDYLALSLKRLKEEHFKTMKWKVEGTDWIEVARHLDDEVTKIKKYMDYGQDLFGIKKPDTPWLDDVKASAKVLGLSEDQLLYEIRTYATRNSFVHSGVSHLIENCEWHEFASHTIRDLNLLNDRYKGHPDEQIRMRRCIKELQRDWFEWVREVNGKAVFKLSEKAWIKTEKMLERIDAEELAAAQAETQLNAP